MWFEGEPEPVNQIASSGLLMAWRIQLDRRRFWRVPLAVAEVTPRAAGLALPVRPLQPSCASLSWIQ